MVECPVSVINNKVHTLGALQLGAYCGNHAVIQEKHTRQPNHISDSHSRHIYLGIINSTEYNRSSYSVVWTCLKPVIRQFNATVDWGGRL